MIKSRLHPLFHSWPRIWPGAVIFCLALTIFSYSGVHQLTDSDYSMLASQSLLEHGNFALDHYALPRHAPLDRGYYFSNGMVYQLEFSKGRLLYHLPPGSSVLSVPYVGLMKVLGISTTNPDGTYNRRGESTIEFSLAALLMSVLAVMFFSTARLAGLPTGWCAVVAMGGVLGTQVWSTASRAMWSDTWGLVFLAAVVWLVLSQEVAQRRLNPFVLASLLAWLFFIRPTYAVHILAVTVYVFIFFRQIFGRYALTGALWFIVFVAFSSHYYGRMLPTYYQANRLSFTTFWTALSGNLISPARGLLVYVPIVFFVTYLLIRYWKYVTCPRLVVLSLVIMLGHLISISGFHHWWGGHSFGARFSTGLVPWFVLLGILGVKAMLTAQEREGNIKSSVVWKLQLVAGGMLLCASMFINARGAMSQDTWFWNSRPKDVDQYPERLWDWREPQFLAGWLPTPQPPSYALPESVIDFSSAEADSLIWYGWSPREERFRWTDGKEAAIVFGVENPTNPITLQTKLGPFLIRGKHDEQRVLIRLNDQLLEALTLREDGAKVYDVVLPSRMLRKNNVLSFALPDAAAPASFGITSPDTRQLGIAVYWMQFQPQISAGAK